MPRRAALPLFALLLAGLCRAAPLDPIAVAATPVRIAATAGDDFADLAPFGAAVGSARIVALDEQTHGGREEFMLKTRLLRYLHERLGFDVLVLESGFFDVGFMQRHAGADSRIADLAPGNVFFMYSKSSEGRAMLQYVDATRKTARPLTLVGMDSQHTGLASQHELARHLGAFVASEQAGPVVNDSPLPASERADAADFKATVEAMLALRQEPPSAAQLAGFDRESARILGALAKMPDVHPGVESAGWWTRVVIDLQAQAQQMWVAPRGNARDQAMGDNVVWIAEHLVPGKRLVVWGHAIHLMHDAPNAVAPPFAGTVIHRKFGADYHVAHLTGLAGRYLDYTTLQPADIPAAPAAGLEARLAQHAGDALYLAPTTTPPSDAPPARYIDYQPFGPLPGRGLHWESTFFIRQLTPVTMVR